MTAPALIQRFRNYLDSRPDVRRILANTGWLFSDRVIRLTLVLLVSAWVTRYLGAEQYGYLSLAMAFMALAAPLLRLGMDTLVIRLLVEDETNTAQLLGTTFVIRLVAALVILPLVVVMVAMLYAQNPIIAVLTGMLSFAVVAECFDVVDFWNQSQVASRNTVMARNAAFVIVSMLKVAAILAQAPLLVFGMLYALDTVLYIVLLVWVYRRHGGAIRLWRWNPALARQILRMSFPLIISAVSVALYMRIDQLMLSLMIPGSEGDRAVGIYSVAVRLSETWYFVPGAIISSVFPAILLSKKQDETLYRKRIQRLFNLVVLVSYAFAIPVTLLAPVIIDVLFGPEFAEAAPQLAVLAWVGVWSSLGVARTSVLHAENHISYSMYAVVAGAFVNVTLNWLLIPIWGGLGCAVATLITQIVATHFSTYFFTPVRYLGNMQSFALLWPNPFPPHVREAKS